MQCVISLESSVAWVCGGGCLGLTLGGMHCQHLQQAQLTPALRMRFVKGRKTVASFGLHLKFIKRKSLETEQSALVTWFLSFKKNPFLPMSK